MSKFQSAPESTDTPTTEKAMPKWKIGKDEKAIAAIEARIAANKNKRNDARSAIIEFIKTYGDENVKKAASALWPQALGGKVERAARTGAARVTSADFLKSLFPAGVGATVSEMDIFTNFQYGRAEMRSHIVRAIKQAKEPADRVWVAFDFDSKSYVLKGIGADIPEGWTGYKPVTVDGEEIK